MARLINRGVPRPPDSRGGSAFWYPKHIWNSCWISNEGHDRVRESDPHLQSGTQSGPPRPRSATTYKGHNWKNFILLKFNERPSIIIIQVKMTIVIWFLCYETQKIGDGDSINQLQPLSSQWHDGVDESPPSIPVNTELGSHLSQTITNPPVSPGSRSVLIYSYPPLQASG